MLIFGREPVYYLATVAIVLKLVAAYGLTVSDDQQAVINAVLAAAVGIASAIVLKTGAVGAVGVGVVPGTANGGRVQWGACRPVLLPVSDALRLVVEAKQGRHGDVRMVSARVEREGRAPVAGVLLGRGLLDGR
jgi:hypothetical protein